jgi:hypothetical protein
MSRPWGPLENKRKLGLFHPSCSFDLLRFPAHWIQRALLSLGVLFFHFHFFRFRFVIDTCWL